MQLLYQNLWIVPKTGSFGLVLQQFAWNPVLVIIVCMMSPNLQFWTGRDILKKNQISVFLFGYKQWNERYKALKTSELVKNNKTCPTKRL